MPRGDKSSYTGKQTRQAEHIEEGYEARGTPKKEAKRRAWATVNKETGGGKKSGSGRGKKVNRAPSRKGGKKGGQAAARRPKAARSASARKAAATRKRRAGTAARKGRSGTAAALPAGSALPGSRCTGQVLARSRSSRLWWPVSRPEWPRFTAQKLGIRHAESAGRAPGAAP